MSKSPGIAEVEVPVWTNLSQAVCWILALLVVLICRRSWVLAIPVAAAWLAAGALESLLPAVSQPIFGPAFDLVRGLSFGLFLWWVTLPAQMPPRRIRVYRLLIIPVAGIFAVVCASGFGFSDRGTGFAIFGLPLFTVVLALGSWLGKCYAGERKTLLRCFLMQIPGFIVAGLVAMFCLFVVTAATTGPAIKTQLLMILWIVIIYGVLTGVLVWFCAMLFSVAALMSSCYRPKLCAMWGIEKEQPGLEPENAAPAPVAAPTPEDSEAPNAG